MQESDAEWLMFSRALAVDDASTVLLVVILGDPGGGEGAKGGEGWGTLPDSELTVGGGDDLNFCTSWGKANDLVFKSVWKSLVHGGTTREDKVLAEILSDVNVGSLDGLPGELVHGLAGLSVQLWLEEELWACDSDSSWNIDDSLVW